jgi:inositol 3-alpha-galactosyltransferase
MAAPVIKRAASARAAYVTFLAGTGDYWKGIVGLAKGLRAVNSAYPLVVAVLPDVPEAHRHALLSQGCVVREVQPVYPPESQTRFAWAYYIINYSKLRIWELVEYERMVYLDADVQVYENIDHLFDLEMGHLYAVKDCFCEGRTYVERAVPGQGGVLAGAPTALLQRRRIRARAQPRHRPGAPRQARHQRPHRVRRAGLP